MTKGSPGETFRPERRVLVIGAGNPYRGDDAAGPLVARRLRDAATSAGSATPSQAVDNDSRTDSGGGATSARPAASAKPIGPGAGVEARDPATSSQSAQAFPSGLEIIEREGEATSLVAAWQGFHTVVLVDAVCSGATPGTIHRFDASSAPLPATAGFQATHSFGVAQAVELARALGQLPQRVIVYGIEGASFETGAPPSPAVQAAIDEVAGLILRDIASSKEP
ncbi:MAG: hydrogenase maturation protease [Actinomycetota bacterium]